MNKYMVRYLNHPHDPDFHRETVTARDEDQAIVIMVNSGKYVIDATLVEQSDDHAMERQLKHEWAVELELEWLYEKTIEEWQDEIDRDLDWLDEQDTRESVRPL